MAPTKILIPCLKSNTFVKKDYNLPKAKKYLEKMWGTLYVSLAIITKCVIYNAVEDKVD